jgi:hypothetical protein
VTTATETMAVVELERESERLADATTETEARLRKARETARSAAYELDRVAALEADDELAAAFDLSPSALQAKRTAEQNRLAQAEETAAECEQQLRQLAWDTRKLDETLAEARLPALVAELEHECAVRDAACERMRSALLEAIAADAEIRAARARVDATASRLSDAAALVDAEAAPASDEPDWLPAGWERPVELVQGALPPQIVRLVGPSPFVGGGPQRPRSEAEQTAESRVQREEARVARLVRELAEASFGTPLRYQSEPVEDVVRRLVARRRVPELFDAVMAKRAELTAWRDRFVAEQNERARATWPDGAAPALAAPEGAA